MSIHVQFHKCDIVHQSDCHRAEHVSIGLYPEFVQRREKLQRGLGKPAATLVSAVGILRSSDPVELDRPRRRGRAWSLLRRRRPLRAVGSAAPLRRHGVDDGMLDVRVLRAGSRARTRGAAALSSVGAPTGCCITVAVVAAPIHRRVLDTELDVGCTARPGYRLRARRRGDGCRGRRPMVRTPSRSADSGALSVYSPQPRLRQSATEPMSGASVTEGQAITGLSPDGGRRAPRRRPLERLRRGVEPQRVEHRARERLHAVQRASSAPASSCCSSSADGRTRCSA